MIDAEDETIITLAQAAEMLSARHPGRPASRASVDRWARTGCRRVVLETWWSGGTRFTTREAVDRFREELQRERSERRCRSEPNTTP